jgi:hypothetical protein
LHCVLLSMKIKYTRKIILRTKVKIHYKQMQEEV